LIIVDQPSPTEDYSQLASSSIHVPATKVAWEPRESLPHDGSGGRGELLATSGDVLRLWEMGEGGYDGKAGGYVGRGWSNGQGAGYSLNPRAVLTNVSGNPPSIGGMATLRHGQTVTQANQQSKLPATSLPPITSLSWNAVAPNSVVTCSIDTTATLWDITNQTAVTQLIAHDKAVYDL